jgi:Protein of unknown function (DUF4231)
MTPKTSYEDWLKQDLGSLIDALSLSDLQKRFLRSRWLDQVIWMEKRAGTARNRYYALRMGTIIGGVIVPALVSLNLGWGGDEVTKWLAFGISLLVAMCAAVEEFFHHGERWRHYRRTVESLKTAGWQFFQLTGPYNTNDSHAAAYRAFAAHVEEIMQQDVDVYVRTVVQEKTEKKPESREKEGSAAEGA